MRSMKDPYVQCYVAGRYDTYEGELELEAILERAVSPGMVTIREASMTAAKKAVDAEMDAATKVQWLKDNLEEIKAMGGDTEKAWSRYLQGRVDNLAHQTEADIVSLMEEQLEGDEEDEDDDEEGEDEDDDEESDDDDDSDGDDDVEEPDEN